jgi:tetratricopeptide (TPR) repeat protein
MDAPTDAETEAVAGLIGRGAAEAMRSESFDVFRAWVAGEIPARLPALQAGATSEQALRAGINAIATTIWNAAPLPSNGYRPRPLPAPGRNDPCPCGSGAKFKRCCGSVSAGFPVVPEEHAWILLTGHLTNQELTRFARDPALPPGPLAAMAVEMRERGDPDTARAVLASRLASPEALDERDEPALDAWLELEGDVREPFDFLSFGRALGDRLPRRLQPVVLHHLAPAAIAARELGLASEALDRLRTLTPDDPALGPLEVTVLLSGGETSRAAERARFWLSWFHRRGFDEEMPEAVEFLRNTARDPEQAALEFRAAGPPLLTELARLVAAASVRPVRPYRLEVFEGQARFGRPPKGVRKVEEAWQRVWTERKPPLVALDVELPDSLIEEPEPWLALVRERPEAFDSLDVLDGLVLLAGPAAEQLDPGWDAALLGPLVERAAAIVRASVAAAECPVRLPWGFWENRPALRLMSRLGYRLDGLDRTGEAAEVYEEILRLNPNDNHGHRTWLVNHYLRSSDPARALAIAERFPADALADTLFGHGLALWRLGNRPEAEKALRSAAAARPLIVEVLLAPELSVPALTPGRVTVGGEDEAWLYREEMLAVWATTPEALGFLRGLPKPVPKQPRSSGKRRR